MANKQLFNLLVGVNIFFSKIDILQAEYTPIVVRKYLIYNLYSLHTSYFVLSSFLLYNNGHLLYGQNMYWEIAFGTKKKWSFTTGDHLTYEIFYDRKRKRWPFNTRDCLIEMTASTNICVSVLGQDL